MKNTPRFATLSNFVVYSCGVWRVWSSTGVWVDAERRHGGVLVHEAVGDPSIGALVSIHGVDLQHKRSCRLVLQD